MRRRKKGKFDENPPRRTRTNERTKERTERTNELTERTNEQTNPKNEPTGKEGGGKAFLLKFSFLHVRILIILDARAIF